MTVLLRLTISAVLIASVACSPFQLCKGKLTSLAAANKDHLVYRRGYSREDYCLGHPWLFWTTL